MEAQMKPQPAEYYPSLKPVADSTEPAEPKTLTTAHNIRRAHGGSARNLARHNSATGARQEFTDKTQKDMAGVIRKMLAANPLSAETVAEIEADREAEAKAEVEAEKAKSKRDALQADYDSEVGKLENLTSAPEPIDLDAAVGQRLELEKQTARVDILKGRLPAVRAAATEASTAANSAHTKHINRKTLAARDMSKRVMPAPHGPLVDFNAAVMSWALDKAMNPESRNRGGFPSCSLGEFIDHHFNDTTTKAFVEIARAEISQVIQG